MIDLRALGRRSVQTRDQLTLLISLGITARNAYNRNRRAGIDAQIALVELTEGNALEQLHNIALDTWQHNLGLGVAHTHVILNHIGIACNVHQTDEYKSVVVDLLLGKTCNRRAHDTLLDLAHKLLVGKRNGRNGTHTACIQTGVALANTLVVLRNGQNLIVLTVGCNKHRALDTAQILLNHHAGTRLAKLTIEHLLQLVASLVQLVENHHTLTCCQTISLQYVGRAQRAQELNRSLNLAHTERTIGRRRNIVAHHKCLGVLLTALQTGTLARRTDHRNVIDIAIAVEEIDHTTYQRILGTYNNQIDIVAQNELLDRAEIGRRQIDIRAFECGAGITRCDIEICGAGTACNAVSKSVFASARTEQ